MKNVLMITYTFPPHAGGGVQRNLKFAKYLRQFGWEPTMVTIKPYKWGCMDHSFLEEIPAHVDVRRCYSLELRRAPEIFQPVLSSKWMMKIRRLLHLPDHSIGWLPYAMYEIKQIMKYNKHDSIIFLEVDMSYSIEAQFIDFDSVVVVVDSELNTVYMNHQKNMFHIDTYDTALVRKDLLDKISRRFVESLEQTGHIKLNKDDRIKKKKKSK